MSIRQIVEDQRAFYATGATLPIAFRWNALAKLRLEIGLREADLLEALRQDLGKVPFEGYMTEVGIVLQELGFIQKHFPKWARDRRVRTPLTSFPGKSFTSAQPYGVALVMAPWNYPFQLSFNPLIGAVAAGNCVVLKPSAYAPATSTVMREICDACFAPGHVKVVEGGRAENTELLEQRFDTIFFTGSVEVGKLVMEKAARHLTPVTLELGGKSPCIVDETADLRLAARRIAFGKYLNAGQTCVAPDYVLVQRQVKDELIVELKKAVHGFFGKEPLASAELPRIVNQKHFDRLRGLMEGEQVALGGGDDGALRIEPTILDNSTPESPVMQEEIFGPVLPVLGYDTIADATAFVNGREKPLALYLFTKSRAAERQVLAACSFGGGCINDTIMHLASTRLPFGGVGQSGMGSYHGRQSFETFTHRRSVLRRGMHPDVPARYHPYTAFKQRLLRLLMK